MSYIDLTRISLGVSVSTSGAIQRSIESFRPRELGGFRSRIAVVSRPSRPALCEAELWLSSSRMCVCVSVCVCSTQTRRLGCALGSPSATPCRLVEEPAVLLGELVPLIKVFAAGRLFIQQAHPQCINAVRVLIPSFRNASLPTRSTLLCLSEAAC